MSKVTCTILIIEDFLPDQELYRRCLLSDSSCAYRFLAVETAKAALELCRTQAIDAILLDYLLPDADGLAFLEALHSQSNGNSPPIVMITGEGDESIAVRAIKLGAEDYLVKRYLTPDLLRSTMRSAIENARLRLQLQQSETRFRTSIENMLDCFAIFSAIRDEAGQIIDFRIDYLNAAALESNQMTAADIGKNLCEVLPAHRETGLFAEYCRVVETGEPLVKENLIYADRFGTQHLTRAYDVHASQLDDGFVASWRDVTARKQAELILRASEERWQLALKGNHDGIWDHDLRSNCQILSDRCLEMLGYAPAAVSHFSQWLSYVHPEDVETLQAAFQQHLRQETETYRCEYRVRCQDGSYKWVLSRGQALWDDEGTPIRAVGSLTDITEAKQTEMRLRESERRFRAIFNTTFQFIGLLTPAGILIEANQTALNFGGLNREETIGRPFWEGRWWTISPETQAQLKAAIDRAAQGEFVRYEVEILGMGDAKTTIDFSLKPVRDEAGQVVLLIPEGRDISDRLHSERDRSCNEQRLQESEARLQVGVQVAGVAIAHFDYASNQVTLSPEAAALYGFPADQAVITREQIHATFHPEERDQLLAKIQQVLNPAGAGWFAQEHRVVWQTGEVRWLSVRKQVFFDRTGAIPQPDYAILAAIDITDRQQVEAKLRQSEERYRYLAGLIPQLVWIADSAGTLLDVNDRWSAYTGFTLEQAQSRGWNAVVHPEDVAVLSAAWTAAQQEGTQYQTEGRMRRADGAYRWHLHQAMPLQDHQGQIVKWFGTATDIHELKQIEADRARLLAEAQAARVEAEAANRSKDEFVSLVAHELRSPLNAILGWAKLLQTRQLDAATTSKALETIARNTQAQVQLVEDLLDVSRMQRGTLPLELAAVNLAEAVEAAIETIRPTAEAKSLQLETQLQETAWIRGDVHRLQQVVLNLLTNAIKFTPAGGRVQVRLERQPALAQIQVMDTGKGISSDLLPHIFDRFRQDQHNATAKQGLGLGLAIVKYLVEMHSGTIVAHSRGEGQGATFTIRLPLLQDAAAVPPDVPSESADVPSRSLVGVRVLLVDDDLDLLNLTVFILEQAGAVVQTATGVAAALAQLPQFQPDILLSDIAMPEQNGYELLQQARSRYPEAPILAIALTAYASATDRENSLRAGFADHLAKPVEPEALIRVVLSVMQRRKL